MISYWVTPHTGVGGALTVLRWVFLHKLFSPYLCCRIGHDVCFEPGVNTMPRAGRPLREMSTYYILKLLSFLVCLAITPHNPIMPICVLPAFCPCTWASFSFHSCRNGTKVVYLMEPDIAVLRTTDVESISFVGFNPFLRVVMADK